MRKIVFFLSVLLLIVPASYGQQNQWTWMKGDNSLEVSDSSLPVYGPLNVPGAGYRPGGRVDATMWPDASGNIWLFGGRTSGSFNDLWKYNPASNEWTWVKGDNTVDVPGIYSNANPSLNKPGARYDAVGWVDGNGDFWLFGGYGKGNTIAAEGRLNDLWKYTVASNTWTFIKGDNIPEVLGVYSSATLSLNKPGGRLGATGWREGGNLWLYGGFGKATTTTNGLLSDLWRFNILSNNWTFIKGSNVIDVPGIYSNANPSLNKPGARYAATTWVEPGGKAWLFGGRGNANSTTTGKLNDLWSYDPVSTNWTWVKGDNTIDNSGVYTNANLLLNKPGGRNEAVGWSDASGDLWLFGGDGYANSFGTGQLNDLWKYSKGANTWTWVKGNNTYGNQGVYGTQGIPSAVTTPGSRYSSAACKDASGNFWLYAGAGYGYMPGSSFVYLNELWKYNPVSGQWTWVRHNNLLETFYPSHYGTQLITDPLNKPGGRSNAANWTDATGNFWLFGGYGRENKSTGMLNDMWKYVAAGNNWVWLKGDSTIAHTGVYGSLGQSAAVNKPGSRNNAVTWRDISGNLWLFGGQGFGNSGEGNLNDLWKYTISDNSWTWIKGDSSIDKTGIYNQSAAQNKPGGRSGASSWTDAAGNFWLFGGYGLGSAAGAGELNDLWKYNPVSNEWLLVKGDDFVDQAGVYGALNVPGTNNKPGGRNDAATWIDATGKLWLFGGYGWGSSSLGELNDLWKYDPAANVWTWVKGTNLTYVYGVYGTIGVSSINNAPGSRWAASFWADANNNLWLKGGNGSGNNSSGLLDDLWKYNIASNQWTWVNGNDGSGFFGEYGTQTIPDPANSPGGRFNSSSWKNSGSQLWMFGGYGYGSSSPAAELNDLWKYELPCPGTILLNPVAGPVCFSGSPVTLTSSGGTGPFVWYKNDVIIPGQSGSSYTTPTAGSFRVKGSAGACTNVYSNEVVLQVPTITPSLGGRGVYCEGTNVNIGMPDTQDDQTYEWLGGGESRYIPVGGGGGNQSLNFAMTATSGGNYVVESTKPGCNTVYSNTVAVYYGGITDLTMTSVCANAVSFSWKDYGSPVKRFQYLVTLLPDPPSSGITTSSTSASWSSGLSANTQYYLHVRGASIPDLDINFLSFCSDWVTIPFTTPAALSAPTLSPVSATICQGKQQLLTATGGDSYVWTRNGSTISGVSSSTYPATLPGTYRVTAFISGCDQLSVPSNVSVITVTPAPTSTTSIAVCANQLPFIWNGNSYSTAGTYAKTLSTAAGCDSIATLILSIAPPKTSTTNTAVCSNLMPYTWNGITYTTAGTYTANLIAVSGCDSIATLNLTVKPTAASTTNASVCSNLLPYVWNGINYTVTGVYTKTLIAANGCDSIATLNLTVKPTSTSTTNVAICTNQLPYAWNGNIYTGPGSYTVILIAANGCDSVARLNLTVNTLLTSTTNVTICTNQLPYIWNGNNYTATGVYNVSLLSMSGCDSIATLNLTVSAGLTSTTTVSVCSNQLPYSWNGNNYTTTGVYTITLMSAGGCDSVAALNFSVRLISTSTTTISRCANQLPYNWNGINYTTSGVYTATLINAVGCDSVATLNFTVNPVLTSTTNVSICTNQLPYTWNGNTYSSGGTYNKTLIGSNGCDSIATLILSVNTVLTSTTNAAVCTNQLPYLWNGNTYSSTGVYNVTLQSVSGCDSVATLNLLVKPVLTSTTNASACVNRLPYIWNGNNYSVAGTFTVTLTGSNGCDSVATLHLIINPVLTSTTNVTACTNQLPYSWNGNNYNASGVYNVTLVASTGCDSVATLNLTINTVLTSTTNISICTTQLPYSWNGKSYTAAGVYTITLTSSNNCDSIATLNLAVNTVLTSTTNIAVCNNQLPYSWNGNNYSVAGTYNVTLTSVTGCDSIATLNLTIKAVSASTTNTIICSNQLPYTWNGNTYTAAGTFAVTLTGSNGCDSVATLNLTVNPVRSSITNVSICTNQLPYVWNGNNYTAAGNYTVTLISSLNCDSIATLHLTVNPVLTSTTNISVCSNQLPYNWNGNNYTTAGIYTVTLISSANCDSLATLNLIITAALTSTTNVVICSNQLPYTWNGNNYTATGTYTVTLIGSNNCDSVAKLILTVNPVLTSTTNASVCVNRLPYIWNGNNYTASGTYTVTLTGSNNCDSIATLRLTVNPLSSSITNVSVCVSRLPYIWNGNNYNSAGTYTVVLISSVNCDSIATLNLTVNPVVTSTTNITICTNQLPYNWNGNTYNAAGTYTVTLVSAANCDSLATLILAVTPLPTGTITPASATICTGSSKLLTATGGTSYQWLLSGSPISGSSNGATYTATQAGVYSVIITNNNCSAPASNTSTILVDPVPTGTISPANTTICPGSSQLLTATGGVSYQWYLNSVAINGAVAATYSASAPGVYTAEIFNANGCKGTASNNAGIIHYSKPVPAFSFDVFCQNQPINFFNTSTAVNSGGVNYTWNFGDNTSSALFAPVHTYSEAKSFTVTLTAISNTCPLLSDSIKKAVAVTPAIPGIKYPPARVIKNTAFTLTARNIGQQYAWNPSFGLSNAAIYNPVVTTAADLQYTIKITSAGGCITVDTLLVQAFANSEVFVPKAFTPNGNNANDLLRPIGVNIPDIKYFRVYNRWGQLVFQTQTAGDGWNGIYKNVPQPMETYTWIFEGTDANGTVIKASGKTLLIR